MDAAQALADLTEISSQIEGAVLVEEGGRLVASTFGSEGVGERVGKAGLELLRAAETGHDGRRPALTHLQAASPDGAVFVVRDDDHAVVAVTGPAPTAGLVFYDLKTCLRLVDEKAEPSPPPKRGGATAHPPKPKPDPVDA